MSNLRISPQPCLVTREPRVIDLDALRRYLRATGAVLIHAARSPNPRELLAAVNILRRDLPRGLAGLEGRA